MTKTAISRKSRKPYQRKTKAKPVEESPESSESSESSESISTTEVAETMQKQPKVMATEDSSIIPSLVRLARRCNVISLNDDAKSTLQQLYQEKLEEILRTSLIFTANNKRKRLFVEDVENALKSMNLNVLFSLKQSIKTCPSFVRKQPKSKNSPKFHKGTVARRQVEKIQKEIGSLFIPRENFNRYARQFVNQYQEQNGMPEITFQDKVITLVQFAVESELCTITENAHKILETRKQSTLTGNDILLAHSILNSN